VLGFSDLPADIAAALIRHGLQVHVLNQRSVEGIFDMIGLLGAMVGVPAKAAALIKRYRANLEAVRHEVSRLTRQPRVYFEEWDGPLISGIRWVSELIGIAGGEECFPS
jgi:iron complex transport system substrate-binding protein